MDELEPKTPIQPTINAVQPQAQPTKETGAGQINPPVPPYVEPSPEGHSYRTNCRPDQTPWWKTAIELAAVLAAIWYAVVATRQLIVMNGQLTEMQRSGAQTTDQVWKAIGNLNWAARSMDLSQKATQGGIEASNKRSSEALNASIANFHTDQRAWVGVQNTFVDQFDASNLFKGRIRIVNTGKTPARHVQASVSYIFGQHFVNGPTPQQAKSKVLTGNVVLAPQSGYIIPLNGIDEGQTTPNDLIKQASQHYMDVRRGTWFLFFYGEIRYFDVSGISRVTKWCTYLLDYNSAGPVPDWYLPYCSSYNEME